MFRGTRQASLRGKDLIAGAGQPRDGSGPPPEASVAAVVEARHEDLQQEVDRLKARIAELERASAREPAHFLEALLRALPAVVLRFDPDLKLRFTSRLVPGLTEAQVLGAPALEFIPAADRDRARAIIDTTLRTGEVGFYQTTGPGPDGQARQYDVFIAPVAEADGRVGGCFVALDISAVQEQHRALLDSERSLRLAREAAGIGLWTWDLATNELLWDEQMKQLMGRAEALPLPDYVEQVVHPDDRDEVRKGGERTFTTGRFDSVVHRILKPDGEVRWMVTVGEVERDVEGKPVRLMGANFDVTEQRNAEEQLRRAQKLETIGRLTAGVAHNFNNMLTVMLPNLDLLRPHVPAAQQSLVDDTADAAARAADMVKKLMTLAGQRRPAAPAVCDVAALTRRIVGMCERTFERHIELRVQVDAAEPCTRAGAGDLEQVLMNLLLNARDAVLERRDATPRIEVTVADAPADVRLPGAERVLELRVRDNGAGMSAEALKHAFEPFFTSKEVGRGTGLGLPTCDAIVRDLGGRIELESATGRGTTVSVLLPGCAAPELAEAARGAARTEAHRRVLLVDDEALVRRVVERALGEAGYAVRAAADGAEALAAVTKEPADLILLDRSMPGVPGAALVGALRAAAPKARVVYFSGEDVPADERGVVDGVIQKPVRVDELLATVSGFLRPRGG